MESGSREPLGRRAFLKRAAALSLVPLLAACGGSTAPASSAPASPASAAAKPSSAAPASSASAIPAASGGAAASAKPAASAAGGFDTNRTFAGTLSVLQWSHFVPAYDTDYFDKWAKDWGTKHKVDVKVDHIALADIPARGAAEIAAKSGHDIIGWFAEGGPRLFEKDVLDVSDVVNALIAKNGPYIKAAEDLCKVGTAWRGVPDFYVPFPSLFRKDVMDKVGWTKGTLETWDDLLEFGTKAKAAGNPVGTALSDTSDGQMTWRSLMWSFGAFLTDETGTKVTLDSPETRAALDFAKKLYTQAMTPEVLSWDDSGNNRYLASGKGAWIYNPISAIRSIEDDKNPQSQELAKNIFIAQPLKGPKGQLMSPQFVVHTIMGWTKSGDAAKQFLYDHKSDFEEGFRGSKGYNMPFEQKFSQAPMPVLSDDPKYKVLVGIEKTAHVIGYPGPNTVAANEALNQNVITTMFTDYAARNMSADAAIAKAVKAAQAIYAKAAA
jgi:multiple sugar transport system substrate-binding protein